MSLNTFISESYVFVFLVIIFFILLMTNTLIETKVRNVFCIILFLEVVQYVFSIIPDFLGNTYADCVIESVLSHINYAVRPAILYLVLLISERNRTPRYKVLLGIPLFVTMLLLAVSIPTGLVVYYTCPERSFHRGPLFIISWFILVIYMLLILIAAIRTERQRMEMLFLLIGIAYISCNMFYELMNREIEGMRQTIIALSILVYYLYFQSQIYSNYRIETEKELTKAQIQAMISQIKPHFIYNSLSCIAEMCHEGSPKGEEALLAFSNYLRSCLHSLEDDGLVPFSRELSTIKNFAELELMQETGRLEMIYEINVTGFQIPVLSIETLVENAVKHGIRKKRGGGTVTLRTFQRDHSIIIEVEDDGLGFDSVNTEGTGIGLRNARTRLMKQCAASIDIQSAPGKGTKITITIPEEKHLRSQRG